MSDEEDSSAAPRDLSSSIRPHRSSLCFVPDDDTAARSVRVARGVEHELRLVAVVEGRGAVNRRPAFAHGGDDLAGEYGKAARPFAVAKPRRERRVVCRDPTPRVVADARVPEVV